MKSRRIALLVALAVITISSGWAALNLSTGTSMTQLAGKWLGDLSSEQRAKAQMEYDSPKRLDWHFIPKPERKGLQIKEMTEAQRATAHTLLSSALSQAGYDKATKISGLEKVLRELEKEKKDSPLRDHERYYFTVFGKPASDSRWGLSVEGHHLSLNFVVDHDKVASSTPTFFGANPAEMKQDVAGVKKGTRVLAKEESLGFELLESLSAEQRKMAIIAEKAPSEIRAAGEAQPPTGPAAGLPASKLEKAQAAKLLALVKEYAMNLPSDVAEERMAAIEKAGYDKIYFAWQGADKPGVGHYYRIQGPTFLIEFINVQPDASGNVANHIHSVWRNMGGDFALTEKSG